MKASRQLDLIMGTRQIHKERGREIGEYGVVTHGRADVAGMMELPEIRQSLESLRNALQEQSTHNSQFSKSVDSLAERLEQMQRDFGSLDVELRESVRQLVSDSHQRVEGTVLSALDAIQNQIIRGVERPPGKPPVERFAPRQDATSESPHRQDPRKIISAGPLFTPSENAEDQAEEQDEPAAPTEEEPEEEGNADEGQQEQPQ